MLQTEEVDDDYFTPTSNSKLANIFENPTLKEDNESLRYTPPKKQEFTSEESSNTRPKQNKDLKTCECIILAYALDAFEWEGNEYLRKGKLGFAIMKYATTDTYNIVLYDSNKTTLSNFTIHTNNGDRFVINSSPQSIAYFDNNKKYWSLHGKEDETAKIVSVLKNIKVEFNNIGPHPSPMVHKNNEAVKSAVSESAEYENQNNNHDKESDTDFSISKRTKASILNRMANVGHSVLPTSTNLHERKSRNSSSDSEDFLEQIPKIRKPLKSVVKRNNLEKIDREISTMIETKQITTPNEQTASPPVLYSLINGQLVPVTNTSVIGTSVNDFSSEFNVFLTEQRMNNNELRINVNRTTDKVDQVLDIIKTMKYSQISNTSSSSNFQLEIAQKLLSEYEQKIKNYEQLLSTKSQMETINVPTESDQPLQNFKNQISGLQNIIKEKEIKIYELQDLAGKQESLSKEVNVLKDACASKDEEIKKLREEMHELKIKEHSNLGNKVKGIMNDLFHAMVMKIDDGETYSGENVKRTMAAIIKNTTIHYLNETRAQN